MLRRFSQQTTTPLLAFYAAATSASPASLSLTLTTSRHASSKVEWGDWSSKDPNNRNGNGKENEDDDEKVNRTNYYDAKQFMSQARGATVICRQKTVVKSFSERLWDYMKPRKDMEESFIDSLQLTKLVLYLIIPILMLIWWKGSYEQYPDYWEKQASQLQSKPLSEQAGKQKYSYHDVIFSLEDKREKAMARQGYEPPSSEKRP